MVRFVTGEPPRRRALAACVVSAVLAACAPEAAPAPTGDSGGSPASDGSVADRYLTDRAYRRAELEASLVNPDNGYSQVRLQHYATEGSGSWDALPEWNPEVSKVTLDELSGSADGGPPWRGAALDTSEVRSDDEAALVALGRAAFQSYPAQLAPYLEVALGSPSAASQYGLWVDPSRGVGGLVRARMADGSTSLALTCSTCHAAPRTTGVEDGAPNSGLDIGRALVDGGQPGSVTPEALLSWGPGRLDVTTTAGGEPVRIADLRPVRWLGYLQADATVANRDRTSLSIRIETLVINSYGQVVRPPRIIALALAAYVNSLADHLPPLPSASARGRDIFDATCASCHTPPAMTGSPIALDAIGTDPVVGHSADRGTGAYRVPSLRGVGTRGPLLHDATLPSIAALLDPLRVTPGFADRLHGPGAVPGHEFGLELPDADRAALVDYLQAL
jgi:mono/diheme cytochrome c family protein